MHLNSDGPAGFTSDVFRFSAPGLRCGIFRKGVSENYLILNCESEILREEAQTGRQQPFLAQNAPHLLDTP
jgi:hypothetical protein